jgi:acyl-CoA synthetase (AMP-forming)/AMP-acid ligase II
MEVEPTGLLDALHRLETCPSSVGVHVVGSAGESMFHPYREFHRRSLAVANRLRAFGVRDGDPVVIALPSSLDQLAALAGTVLAGGVVVCLNPGLLQGNFAAHCAGLARATERVGARVCIAQEPLLGGLERTTEMPAGCIRWNPQLSPAKPDQRVPHVDISPANVAVIQHTSGTTGRQKGALITHGNVTSNVTNVARRIGVTAADVIVSWLPLFHDMGLGAFFGALWCRATFVLIPTQYFVHRPETWLRTITRFRGTISAAPNFAYARCNALPDTRLQGLRLQSWRIALSGGERALPETVEDFARRFASMGLRREALHPVYGLAEATCAVTVPAADVPYRVDAVEASAVHHVSVGRPFPDHTLRIVDGAGAPLPERAIGEIVLHGPSVCSGYLGDSVSSSRRLAGLWLHTGDLGYLAGGDLHVVGRLAGKIIICGRNYHAEDIEEIVERLPDLRPGGTIAYADVSDGTERLMLTAEVRHASVLREAAELEARVRHLVSRQFDLVPAQVALLPPGALGRTSSGKKQRQFRGALLAGNAQ